MAGEPWRRTRAQVVRNALGIGVASGAYALSFGAISTAAGLSIAQTCTLSLLMFTGASQFALVGVIGAGGSAVAGAATAFLLGLRNGLYGLRLSPILRTHGPKKPLAAHLVIDESTAMAIAQPDDRAARLGFWVTGISIFVFWNLATLIGALSAAALSDPKALGLDAAVPAAFVALLWSRMRSGETWIVAALAAAVALASVPFIPIGGPVLIGALVAVVLGLRPEPDSSERRPSGGPQ